MSLLTEIQDDIFSEKSLSSILRKARVLAHRLKNQEFKNWVDSELNGYAFKSTLIPDYRKFSAPLYGDFIGEGMRMKGVSIPSDIFSKDLSNKLSNQVVSVGVVTIESYIDAANNEKQDELMLPVPIKSIKDFLTNRVIPGMLCVDVWKAISRQQLAQILETVRDRLQNFILELSDIYPNYAKTDFDNNPSISSSTIVQIFQKNIYNNPIFVDKEIHMGDKIDIKMGDVSNVSGQLLIGKFNEVVANLNNSGQTEFAEALKILKDSVMASQHIPDEKKKEHVEVINQIDNKATKEKPNKTLLKVMGDGLLSILKAIPDVAKAVAAVAPFLPQ